MCSDRVTNRLDADEQSLLLQLLNHELPRLIAVHAGVLSALVVHCRIIIQDIDLFKVVALADLKVVRIVGRCDLDAACSELHVDVVIGDDRNLTVRERKLQHLSDDILIPLVLRIDCDCRVAKQRLRSCRRNLNELSFFPDNRIEDVPEVAVLIDMLDLRVGNGRLALRAPVDALCPSLRRSPSCGAD